MRVPGTDFRLSTFMRDPTIKPKINTISTRFLKYRAKSALWSGNPAGNFEKYVIGPNSNQFRGEFLQNQMHSWSKCVQNI